MGINTQKYIFLLIFICVNINTQEIVNETIDTQVSASSLSQDAQKKIDNLDIKSKEIYYLTFLVCLILTNLSLQLLSIGILKIN